MVELLIFLATALFLGGIFTLFYAYVGFPLTLKLIRDIKISKKAEAHKDQFSSSEELGIQVTIPCYNEAKSIEKRIENILTQDYPSTILSVLVISDGSTDDTIERVRKLESNYANLFLYSIPNNIGKNNALNLAHEFGYFTAPILCFTDADTEFAPGSLKSAIKYFSDPRVGLVGGHHLAYWPTSDSAGRAEGVFRRLENFLRRMEGDLGWLLSAPGTFIMMRRELYEPLPNHLNNDFALPLSVLGQGYATKFDQHALVGSLFPADTRDLLSRRKRTIIRALSTLARHRPQLPRHLRLVLFWHKTVRFYGFPIQVAILAANLLLVVLHPTAFWTAMFCLQAIFYFAAGLGALAEQFNWQIPFVHLPFQFTLQNAAAFSALVVFWRGQQVSKWTPSR
jgi:biofilm PGA synthesis N-glycosyltransferase PgaC